MVIAQIPAKYLNRPSVGRFFLDARHLLGENKIGKQNLI